MLESGLLAWGSGGSSGTQLIVTSLVAMLGLGLLLWIARDRAFDAIGPKNIALTALLVRLVAMLGMPILEDDHYRYLWDGMQTATTMQPYAWPPSAFFGDSAWGGEWQAILNGINNPDVPTIYGPTLQYLFAVGYLLAPARLIGIQVLLATVDMGALMLLMRAQVPARYLLAYAVHPLVVSQGIVSAHPDSLVGCFVLASLMAWRSHRSVQAGAWLGLALGTKVSALLVLPFLCWPASGQGARQPAAMLHHVRQLALGLVLCLVALYGPFMLRQGSETAALQTFASQWQFNPLGFRLLLALGLDGALARCVAAGVIVLAVAGLVWWWRRAPNTLWPPVDLACAALLVMSPVVNPWYWLWCLAPSLLRQTPWCLAFGVLAVVSYLNSTVLFEAGWLSSPGTGFAVSWLITALELLGLFTTVAFDWRYRVATYQLESK